MLSINTDRFLAPDGSLRVLVDCNNFFVSCERIARPDLNNKPVIVLSSNDGCIVARSNEVKALGIKMGVPEFTVRHLIKQHNIFVFSCNYTLYADISSRVMQILRAIIPDVEVYSIDEAFIKVKSAAIVYSLAQEMHAKIWKWLNIPVSIGIAPTKVLAKLAAEVAKKYPVYNSIFDLSSSTKVDKLLDSTKVKDLWGIGKKSALKLHEKSIFTAKMLRDADPGLIKNLISISGMNIVYELRGITAVDFDETLSKRRTIISSRSFGASIKELDDLKEAVASFTTKATEKMRKQDLCAQGIMVFIRTSYFGNEKIYTNSISKSLIYPTTDTAKLIQVAQMALCEIYKGGYAYAKAGIMLYGLEKNINIQKSLLNFIYKVEDQEESRKKLMGTIDGLNTRYGRHTIKFAAEGIGDRKWLAKQINVSPKWTTDIGDFLVVK